MITKEAIEALCRPIVGIENRTALEVQDIMSDRIRSFLSTLPIAGEGKALVDVLRQGIKDQGYGYTMKGNRLTVSSDEVFAVDLDKLASFILSALISSPGKDGGHEVDYEAIMKSALVAADSEYAIGPDETAFKRAIEAAVNWSFLALSNAQPASTALVEALEVARDQIITMYRTWVVDDATAMPTEISLAGRAVAKIDAALSASQSTSREGDDAQD